MEKAFRPEGVAWERGGGGVRGLPGFPELPGLSGPGVRLGNGEAMVCGACPGFLALGRCREQRKRPTRRAWWGTFRLEKAFRPEGTAGEREAAACGAFPGFPGPGVWPRTKEKARGGGPGRRRPSRWGWDQGATARWAFRARYSRLRMEQMQTST